MGFAIEPAAKRELLRWAIAACLILVAFLAAESAYRVRLFGWPALVAPVEYAATRLDRFDERWFDRRLNGLPVDYRGRERGAPFTTGHLGFRMPDRPMAKPAGTVRIALLGFSIDLGSTVPDDETYAARLQRMADADTAAGALPPVEVLNLSTPGPDLPRLGRLYDEYGRAFDVDAVILPLHLSQPIVPARPTAAAAQREAITYIEGNLLGDFYLAYERRILRRTLWQALGRPRWSAPPPELSEDPAALAHALVDPALVRRIRADGRSVVLAPMLRPAHNAATDADRAVLAYLAREFADDPCIRLLDTLPAQAGRIGLEQRVFAWDNHPDATVHALYADVLYPRLLPAIAGLAACR
jgi:hypothetical protein